MSPSKYAALSRAIDEWMDKVSPDGHEELVYPGLVEDMAAAARTVYDACMRGQTFREDHG